MVHSHDQYIWQTFVTVDTCHVMGIVHVYVYWPLVNFPLNWLLVNMMHIWGTTNVCVIKLRLTVFPWLVYVWQQTNDCRVDSISSNCTDHYQRWGRWRIVKPGTETQFLVWEMIFDSFVMYVQSTTLHLILWVIYLTSWIGHQHFIGEVGWWECHF
jgi:hypothetical protein